eukprot:scaffold899_cov80-Cylindrotheca_fusiformis.AAC.2
MTTAYGRGTSDSLSGQARVLYLLGTIILHKTSFDSSQIGGMEVLFVTYYYRGVGAKSRVFSVF